MPAIKVISKTIPEDPETVELHEIREDWEMARRQMDPLALSGMCSVAGCRTMPFVALRTSTGRRPLCLRHFEKLRVDTV